MRNRRLTSIIGTVLLCLLAIGGCRSNRAGSEEERVHDLQQIKDSGELVVLTLYSSTSYFIYRGQDMGFQYELSEQFAKSLGLKLKVKVARNVRDLIRKLQAGEGDLIAYTLPITKEWKDSLLYCGEEVITHQVIVQRSGGREKPLKDVTELVGKDVYVKPGKYHERLVNLDKELGGGIRIHLVRGDSLSAEDLIAQVAQGKIPYTVTDNDIARLNRTYYPNLNINLAISFDQRSSWAVRRDCPQLARAASEWHRANMTSPDYKASTKRYFEISKSTPHTPILSLREGRISHYDELFKKYAKEIGWDWRLLASLAYTESNFDTAAVSWAGARGLMQLMPSTAHLGRRPRPDAAHALYGPCYGSSGRQGTECRRERESRREVHQPDGAELQGPAGGGARELRPGFLQLGHRPRTGCHGLGREVREEQERLARQRGEIHPAEGQRRIFHRSRLQIRLFPRDGDLQLRAGDYRTVRTV